MTLGLHSLTVFLPFGVSGRSGFQQSLRLSVRVRLPGNTTFDVATNTSPLGETAYTTYATTYAYSDALDPGARRGPPSVKVRLAKHLVEGVVEEADGRPIAGAAIRVGDDLVFSDSNGRFVSRQAQQKQYPLAVLVDEFMFPGRYDVVTAPDVVTAAPDERAEAYSIVLRSR